MGAELEDPPPRLKWEEPPADAWGRSLSGVGFETLRLLLSIAAVIATWKLSYYAHHLGEHPTHGAAHFLIIGLWVIACVLAAAFAVFWWRRIGGIALLGAMLTDYGRTARLGGRPPVWLDAAPADALRVAHLSDLHVAESPRVRLVERAAPSGNDALLRLLAEINSRDELVLMTGDLTDRGTSISWRFILDALAERNLSERVLLVPGNHDLALVEALHGESRQRALRTDRFAITQLANLLKFCEAFNETAGGRRGFVLSDGELKPYEDAWLKAERAVRPLVARLPNEPVPIPRRDGRSALHAYEDRIEAARALLLELFPVALPLPERDAVVFVLNSAAGISRHPATNALGHVGRAQYRRLDRLARNFGQPLKLLALHHHVVRRSEEQGTNFVKRVMAKFTVLGDSRPLVKFCRAHQVRAVLHGHRHLSYQLRLPNGTVLLAAPSSTLGDELADDPRPQFERYTFAAEVMPPSVGIHRQMVHLDRIAVNAPARAAIISRPT